MSSSLSGAGEALAEDALDFPDLTTRGGCDEHLPWSSTVPMMKTVFLSYPAHSLPLSTHFLQNGRVLSHYLERISHQQPRGVLDETRKQKTYPYPPESAGLAPFKLARNANHGHCIGL
jgi:hypothetical protein